MNADAHRPADAYPVTGVGRRDRLVAAGCLWLTALQALPYAMVGWISDGGTAAGDGVLDALSPAALLAVVGFGVVLAMALTRPGLQPLTAADPEGEIPMRPGHSGPVRFFSPIGHPPVMGRGARAVVGADDAGPVLPMRPARFGMRRLGWAALAALADAVVFAAAVLLDSAGRSGASAVGDSLDGGSALWAYAGLVAQVLRTDVRAPLALVVALVVLDRASRPMSTWELRRGPRDPASRPGGRTARRSTSRPWR